MSRGDNVQGILCLSAIGPFWAKWGLGRFPRSPIFCVVIQRTFRQLRNGRFSTNLVTKRSSVSRRGIRKDIFENFHFSGHLPPKSEIENRSKQEPHSELAIYRSRDVLQRDIVYSTLQIKGQGVSDVWSTFFLRLMVRLRSCGASKLPNFRILAYFPYTKPLKG